MDRKKIISNFQKNEEFVIANFLDDIELCLNIEYPIYGKEFYSPSFIAKVEEVKNLFNVEMKFLGLSESSEKKISCIYPKEYNYEDLNFPVVLFEIDGKNKFKTLEHKDFLGTIMSLGIKRELLGDLIVEDSKCYGIALEFIYEMISEKITNIGKIPVKIKRIEEKELPKAKFQDSMEVLSSLRLDAIVSTLINSSRNETSELIESGEVMHNYLVEKKASKIIKEKSVITIRKKGKFIFEKELEKTKKGKIKILIKKYI
ncbi:MAG: YlmH/Sll1252 family protein [Fusobacteriaceae bacterium]